MKKKVFLLSLPVLIIAACFIPVTQQKSILIKAPFLKVFVQLSKPQNWKKWRPDINKSFLSDSGNFSIIKNDSASFGLKSADKSLNVHLKESAFVINDSWSGKTTDYSFVVAPVSDKFLNKTTITVVKRASFFHYLMQKISPVPFEDTHVYDLKNFMETDSLRYGFNIYKVGVPGAYLIEIKKDILTKDKFAEGEKMLSQLQQFVTKHGVKQTQPLIAQFFTANKDSTHINVGLFIDKEVKSEGDVKFTRMPKGGPLYCARYKGDFNKRQKAYNSLQQYFADHLYQSAILPFETYLDNKLPASDTSQINIQVNFSTFF